MARRRGVDRERTTAATEGPAERQPPKRRRSTARGAAIDATADEPAPVDLDARERRTRPRRKPQGPADAPPPPPPPPVPPRGRRPVADDDAGRRIVDPPPTDPAPPLQ